MPGPFRSDEEERIVHTELKSNPKSIDEAAANVRQAKAVFDAARAEVKQCEAELSAARQRLGDASDAFYRAQELLLFLAGGAA